MENHHIYNYWKPYGKIQYINRKSFNYFKKKNKSDFCECDDDYFQKNSKINKDIQKTASNKTNSTEKNQKLNFEVKDKNEKLFENNDNNNSLKDLICVAKLNRKKTNENKGEDNALKPNKHKIINISKKIPLQQPQHMISYYNCNISNNNKYINNNTNYYLKYIPFSFSNSTNNYYINNNIIIYNNTFNKPNPYQYKPQNLYSLLNSYKAIKNINLNQNQNINNIYSNFNLNSNYAIQNYINSLFSRNDENSENTKNNDDILDAKKENTCILEINVKISKDKNYNFRLKRFDDLFETVQIFCQINELKSNLYIPIIVNIIKALNSIYGIYNLKLNEKEINELLFLKYYYFNWEKNNSI